MSTIVQNSEGSLTPDGSEGLKPEWLTVPDAIKAFGIGRSSLYELITDGIIKSACIRKRGNVRGKRLISYDSLAAYVESFAT